MPGQVEHLEIGRADRKPVARGDGLDAISELHAARERSRAQMEHGALTVRESARAREMIGVDMGVECALDRSAERACRCDVGLDGWGRVDDQRLPVSSDEIGQAAARLAHELDHGGVGANVDRAR